MTPANWLRPNHGGTFCRAQLGLFVQMPSTDKGPPTLVHREWAAEGFPPHATTVSRGVGGNGRGGRQRYAEAE